MAYSERNISMLRLLFTYIVNPAPGTSFIDSTIMTWDFPGGSVLKNPPANAGDVGSVPGSGRYLVEGNGNPLQCSCLENSMDRGASKLQSIGSQKVEQDLVTEH